MMLNIVCVKQGEKYGPEYVSRLYFGVRRNLRRPFKFWCLTDSPAELWPGIFKWKINDARLTGWWAKMLLFRPLGNMLRGRVLFFDLDTVITGNLDPLADYSGEFCMLRDFYHKTRLGSGIMAFAAGYGREMWEAFSKDPLLFMREFGGDQDFIQAQVKAADCWQDVAPGTCASYKVHCKQGLPDGAVTVSFHGQPKPDEVNDAWVRHHWIGV
uniref:Putative glycosyltransferase n=1 Tax=viral metagenome TaxID=1070528 RepID=A0A6M3IYW2_9ZZZZ